MGSPNNTAEPSSTNPIIRFYDHDVQAKDLRGRTQDDILSWSDRKLETCHNYIQMLFPLPESSPFNFEAPVITREVFDAFRSRSELRSCLRRSYERILKFYGFTLCYTVKSGKQGQNHTQEDSEISTTDLPIDTAVFNIADNDTESRSSESSRFNVKKEDPIATNLSSGLSVLTAMNYSVVRGPNWSNNATRWCVRFNHNHLRITRILRCLRILGLQSECDAFYQALQDVFDDPAIFIGSRSMMYWTRAVQRPLSIAPDDEECQWLQAWEREQENKGKSRGFVDV